jgi:hypothetical protein
MQEMRRKQALLRTIPLVPPENGYFGRGRQILPATSSDYIASYEAANNICRALVDIARRVIHPTRLEPSFFDYMYGFL